MTSHAGAAAARLDVRRSRQRHHRSVRRRGSGCKREVPALHPGTQEDQREGGTREGRRGFPRRGVVRRRLMAGKLFFVFFFYFLLFFNRKSFVVGGSRAFWFVESF